VFSLIDSDGYDLKQRDVAAAAANSACGFAAIFRAIIEDCYIIINKSTPTFRPWP